MTPLLTLKTRRSSFEGMGEQGRSGVGGQSRGALSLPAAMSACSIFFFLGGGLLLASVCTHTCQLVCTLGRGVRVCGGYDGGCEACELCSTL